MESLEDLSRNSESQAIRLTFDGGGPAEQDVRRQYVNFVRLVDLAIEEHEAARRWAEKSDEPGDFERVTYSLRAIDRLESCLIHLHRALKAFDIISRHKMTLEVPRATRRAIESYESEVKSVRDIVMHVEEWIARGKIEDGTSHALRLSSNAAKASVGPSKIRVHRVAAVLRRLHAVATEVAAV